MVRLVKGIDCAVPLTLEKARAFRAAGYEFAARYLVPERYAWKRLTRAEAEAITAAGMQIVSVYETTANRPAGGAAAGVDDGAEALKEAKEIGQPEGSAIYFAVDYDAQPKDYNAIEAYLRAAASNIPGYRVGVYGSFSVVEEMARRIPGIHVWQTYAWSRGKRSEHANLYQYQNNVTVAGHIVDLNESFGGEGWWNTRQAEKNAEMPEEKMEESPKEHKGENPKMKPEDAEKIIRFLSAAWFATESKEARDEFHRLANEIRKAAGISTAQISDRLGK